VPRFWGAWVYFGILGKLRIWLIAMNRGKTFSLPNNLPRDTAIEASYAFIAGLRLLLNTPWCPTVLIHDIAGTLPSNLIIFGSACSDGITASSGT
jgi:hypothetical protein